MIANTQNVQGEQEREGKKKVRNRDTRRSVEGRGIGWGTQGKDGHDRDFQEGRSSIFNQ